MGSACGHRTAACLPGFSPACCSCQCEHGRSIVKAERKAGTRGGAALAARAGMTAAQQRAPALYGGQIGGVRRSLSPAQIDTSIHQGRAQAQHKAPRVGCCRTRVRRRASTSCQDAQHPGECPGAAEHSSKLRTRSKNPHLPHHSQHCACPDRTMPSCIAATEAQGHIQAARTGRGRSAGQYGQLCSPPAAAPCSQPWSHSCCTWMLGLQQQRADSAHDEQGRAWAPQQLLTEGAELAV